MLKVDQARGLAEVEVVTSETRTADGKERRWARNERLKILTVLCVSICP